MKSRSVYDQQGKAYETKDGEIVWVRKGYKLGHQGPSTSIISDIDPFISPIDGKIIGSRRQLNDHCKRHNVVPTADLKGLPPLTMQNELKVDQKEREVRKRIIGQVMSDKRYFEGR